MTASRGEPQRLAIGQLLGRLQRAFREELAEPRAAAGFGDVREPHLQVFGNIRAGGVRLTELATRASLSLAATSELVNDLVGLGYLERRPDPTDGRAKLIDLTARGRELMAAAGGRVAEIERHWAAQLGDGEFEALAVTLQRLLDALDPEDSRS